MEINSTHKMAKRRRRSDDDDEPLHRRTEKSSPPPPAPRRRLHILANECPQEFSVYKLDVDDFDSEDLMDSTPRRLRRHRLVVRMAGGSSQAFVAVGARIFALHRSSSEDGLSVVYDTSTRTVSAAPPFQAPKTRAAFWAAGRAIYALDCVPPLRRSSGGGDGDGGDSAPSCFERLVVGRAPPRHGEWRWEAMPAPPFEPGNVVSHAAHPDDGATVFVSVYNAGTFSFDGERMAWARRGGWLLPFDGEAFYVRGLRAWVGICLEDRRRVAACQVAELEGRGGVGKEEEPAYRKSAKELLRRRNGERHVRANLTYMGDAEFCVQQTFMREVDDDHDTASSSVLVGPMLLRVVTFRVAYSGDGELCAVDRKARIYQLPYSSER